MARTHGAAVADSYRALVESYAANERMNQVALDHLHPDVWRAKLPGSRGRTIAAIFAHVHNIRRKWLRLSAPQLELPARLDGGRCSLAEAKAALAESGARCCEMIAGALGPERRISSFLRDGWAKPWPASAAMAAYMISHDSHHRGQVCMMAHQLGHPLPASVTSRMWSWERLWKECESNGAH
jgi:uncharacterized damage-inducible protein DinB